MPVAETTIEVRSLAGFGIVFYGLIVIAGCIGLAAWYHGWARGNSYKPKWFQDGSAVVLGLALFVAFAWIAHPA